VKYYIAKYWTMMNSENLETREKGKAEWIKSAKKYRDYYDGIKGKLPKKFMKEYDKNGWFHDFTFDNINVSNTGGKTSAVELTIGNGQKLYKILLSGVTGVILNVPNTQCWMFGKLTWGYSEFELNDDGTWIISILCDIECEIEMLFKKISIEKV
jgi:hypothetical protein